MRVLLSSLMCSILRFSNVDLIAIVRRVNISNFCDSIISAHYDASESMQ